MNRITAPNPFLLLDKDYTLEHPALSKAIDEIKEAIFSPDDTGIVQVVGCTGVGKTHLTQILANEINHAFAEKIRTDRAFLPIARFSVSLITNKGFNWMTFYQEYLSALQHPFPISVDVKTARDKIITAHQSRRPIAVFIDEAQHVLRDCKDHDAIKLQADVLKSLCEKTGGKIVLIGHYDLIPWLRTNGQTARRNRIIHLARYPNTTGGRKTFREILKSIDDTCGASLEVQLEPLEEMIFKGCLGLVGVLRTWLVRALQNSKLEDGKDVITHDALIATKLSTLALMTILEEAHQGEADLNETEADRKYFELLLAEDTNPKRRWPSSARDAQPSVRRRKVPPGRRGPIRDRTGAATP
jgi:type II secretory pathway predicted ATPase ExeA